MGIHRNKRGLHNRAAGLLGKGARKIVNLARKNEFGERLIEVGELIPLMAKQMQFAIEECMNQNAHRRVPYWILYTADWYNNGTVLKDTAAPYGACPPRMLNTICWMVNNVTGEFKNVWTLPKDAPIELLEGKGQVVDSIVKDAAGLPLIY